MLLQRSPIVCFVILLPAACYKMTSSRIHQAAAIALVMEHARREPVVLEVLALQAKITGQPAAAVAIVAHLQPSALQHWQQ